MNDVVLSSAVNAQALDSVFCIALDVGVLCFAVDVQQWILAFRVPEWMLFSGGSTEDVQQ